MKLKSWILATPFLLSAIAVAPVASAHECQSYDENSCDPNNCPEGQDHSHTHLRHWWEGDNEYCRTTKGGTHGDDDCYVADKEFPKGVCDLLDETVGTSVLDEVCGRASIDLSSLKEVFPTIVPIRC